MIRKKLIVATRPSLLAYTQTMQTVNLLKEANPEIEFEVIKYSTKGDRVLNRSLTSFGGTGLFVKELEYALLESKADIAIHSLKDVPTAQPEGLSLESFPQREDIRDVFISNEGKKIEDMPIGFVLGTGSPRRLVQLKAIRPDIQFKEIRGNVDSRIKKMHDGEYDAIILAASGLKRLSKQYPEEVHLDEKICIPAIGQACLVIECRQDDHETKKIIRKINHKESELAVLAERAFMAEIEGGCKFPLAANAFIDGDMLCMTAIVGDLSTGEFITEKIKVRVEESILASKNLAKEMKIKCKDKGINFYL